MAEHKHGSMDITTQEKTFDGFMIFATRFVIVTIVVLLFLLIFWR